MDCAYLEFTYIPGFTVTYAVSSTSNQVITNLSPTESFLIITCSIYILLHHHEFISLLLWLPLLFLSNMLFSIFSDKQRKAAFPHIWEQIFDILPLKVNWCKWSGWFTTLVFNVPNLTFCTASLTKVRFYRPLYCLTSGSYDPSTLSDLTQVCLFLLRFPHVDGFPALWDKMHLWKSGF